MATTGPTTADLVLVTGMSGAGRSAAVDHLGDLGWYAVDNLPVELLPATLELARDRGAADRVALAVGPHTATTELPPVLAELRSGGARVRLVFLDAADEVLVRRFAATARRHPLAGPDDGLLGALDRERRLLAPVRNEADVVLDTSWLSVHDLRRRIGELAGTGPAAGDPRVTLVSFGFKHGIPLDADVVLDCRFLANPQYVEQLRPRTGLDPLVRDYVLGQEASGPFLHHVEGLLAHLLPASAATGRGQLTVALGCTGGRHRSVALTERTAAGLRRLGYSPGIRHRDVQVSTADDSGSTGRLRDCTTLPAPGDLRRCLSALAGVAEEPLGRALEHRFAGTDVEGHALGNLLLCALAAVTGDFQVAVDEVAGLLGLDPVAGRVLPATGDPVAMKATTVGGTEVCGQYAVSKTPGISRVELQPADAPAADGVGEAVRRADQVVLGPGSVYTSILAAALVDGLRDALESTGAPLVYVCNLEPEFAETAGYDVADHVAALHAHGVDPDVVLVQDGGRLPVGDPAVEVVRADLAGPAGDTHDSRKLAAALAALARVPDHSAEV
jgi:uncharacterized cofD-like protein